jgi:O-antigen/teichoic acid export membrane protein
VIARLFAQLRLDPSRVLRLGREMMWIGVGQLCAVLGSFVLVRVLTEHLHPAQYGDFALALTIAALFHQVVLGGLTSGIGRFYSVAVEQGAVGLFYRASWAMLAQASVAIIGIACLAIPVLVLMGSWDWLWLVLAVTPASVLGGYSSAISGIQNAARQRSVVALHSGVEPWLKLGLSLAAILAFGATSLAVVIGHAGAILLVLFSQRLFIGRLLPERVEPGDVTIWRQRLWQYSWPLMAGGIFNWGYHASQRWSLEAFSTTEEVGMCYALTQVAFAPLNQFGALILSFVGPILFSRAGDLSDHQRVAQVRTAVVRLAVAGLVCTALAASMAVLWHGQIFAILVARQYQSVSGYMPTVVIAAGLIQVSSVLGLFLSATNQTRRVLPLATVGNIIVILLNIFLTFAFGFGGTITALLCGAAFHLVWMYRLTLMRPTRSGTP